MEDKEAEKIDQELAEIKMRLSIIERRLLMYLKPVDAISTKRIKRL